MNLLFLNLGGQEMFLILIFPLIFLLIPFIFYLVFLQSFFRMISIGNQRMSPSNVWLLLIPIFGLYWHFVIVKNLSDSIRDEAASMGLQLKEKKPAYNIGIAMCILNCCVAVPGVNALAGPASLVLWILYWVKASEYKNQLSQSNYRNP